MVRFFRGNNLGVFGVVVVGLPVALRIGLAGLRVIPLEKEIDLPTNQTGRNSAVIHADSRPRARFC